MRTNGWDEINFIDLHTLYALIHDSTEHIHLDYVTSF